jgi:hypothetical protein
MQRLNKAIGNNIGIPGPKIRAINTFRTRLEYLKSIII